MFSRIFIERPRLAAVVSLILLLAGGISLANLPVAEYPEIAPPTLFVSATYSGASADVVAQTVAMPLENEINGVEDLLYFSSTSSNSGSYSCSVTFRSGTDSDIALVNLQNAVKRAEAQLPSEVTKAGITVEKRGNDILAMLAFQTDGTSLSLNELVNYVNNNVKDALARLEGVSSSDMMSQQEYAMRIWMDPLRMSGLGISSSEIRSAVEAQNVQAAAGTLGAEGSNRYVSYKLNVQGRLKTAEEFGEIVVRSDADSDRIVRLRDVATVELGSSSYSGRSTFNGKESVGLSLYRSPDANALATMNRIKAELATWEQRFPPGVSYSIAYDPTKFIVASMREMVSTLVVALILVVLVTWLFIQDWRATLIPAVAIPVSLVGTFSVMYALGYSINTLTMFGLILVIGSLVDDAIVVVENTQGIMEREGLPAREAAIKSMGQITGAVIATTLAVACYAPLAFYGGMVGAIYRQFAVSMCVALCLSTVVALTLSPALCALVLRRSGGQCAPIFLPVNRFLDALRGRYLGMTGRLVRRGGLTLGILGGTFLGVWLLYGHIPPSFLPMEDKGVIFCNVELPGDAVQERTDAVLATVRERLAAIPGIRSVMQVSGMSMLSGSGENAAMCIVELDPWEERSTPQTRLSAIMGQIQGRTHDIAAASIVAFTPPAIMGLGATGGASFDICGIGDIDASALATVTDAFVRDLSARPETMFAMTAYDAATPQLRLRLDREKAELLGVQAGTVFSTLQDVLASYYINDFTLSGNNFEVKLQAGADSRSSLHHVEELLIPNSNGDMVPLSALGTLQYEVGPRQITRFNKMVAAEINAQSAPGVSSGDLYAAIEGIKLPAGYHIEWTGLSYQEKQNTGQIVFLMGLALLFAYLFLVAQYESWTIPVPVMLTVSFAVLGALLGLTVCGESMSIYAQLGLVMLIGLAAKNAILMVEFSKQEREGGKGIEEAALSGANLRFRAVMMTAWSFLFGVLPLVFADGAGAASRQAIGITTFAGMLAATCVGIVFTPALYAVFQRLREKASRKFRGGRAALCLLLAVGLSGLGGCTLGPDFKRADADVPENFLPGTLAATGAPLRPSWWEDFHDPLLTALVLEAQEGSLSVRQAVQRVAQSRAARMEARAEFLPDATGTGELARSRNYAPDGTATKLDASVQLTLAVDVFGGLRRSLEAAGADLEAAGISLADARASLAVEVANGYVDLRLAQEKLRIALENVAVQRDTVRVIQARADAGTVAMLDLHAARAQMETTQASVPSAEAEVVAAIRGLEALAGRNPGMFDARLSPAGPIPELRSLPSAVPSDLLRRRPDVRKAEAEHHAATARIGVAQAALFPSFSLVGSGAVTSSDFVSWSDAMKSLGVGPMASWNIFSFGRNKAMVDQARAAAAEAALVYRETVLEALHDVETSWSAYEKESRREDGLRAARDHQRQALRLSRDLYAGGKGDYLDVLTAQASSLSAETEYASHRAAMAKDAVSLVRALGGGWTGENMTQP
ncbi:efflux RND transporter permease subunit [Desulfovibrio piger]|uniref:efflux RND transporter permease subunit n=1 Tax=Desulfovibrio piger TaxID=901 RepID=UPI001D220507|nr:efflux RND transporter permease subunit [Desulfovibrio piger]HJG36113.1 efflux RND transporter permease subunit [Desulfovibrio piger]